MANPTFIYVGPGRAATSWLLEMLRDHPQVGMSKTKETEFFNNNYGKGLQWYESMFPDEQYTARGEISTMYYLDINAPSRIKKHYPEVKILFGAREPVDLLNSFYKFGIRRGLAASTLTDALDQPNAIYMGSGYKARLAEDSCSPGDHVTMLDSVRLSRYLRAFVEAFGVDNVHVVSFEEVSTAPKTAIKEIYRFIGVDQSHEPSGLFKQVNPSLAPKIKILAIAAHKLAYTLRTLGLHSVLSRLHQSDIVKRILFRPQDVDENDHVLPDDIRSELAEESAQMQKAVATLIDAKSKAP